MIKLQAPHNQEYRLTYTDTGLLAAITDSAGQTVHYGYENGILVSVMDEAGDEVRYAYSAGAY